MQPIPTQPPQPQSFWQRIAGLNTSQKIAVGIGAGCSTLLFACLACSALSLALGGSGPAQGNGIPATATATGDTTALPTATTAPTATATTRLQATATTHIQPTNTPHAAQPTKTPCADPCNPWGYNFTCCNLIYNPPSNFCSYFSCINNFWNGTGYVEECQDSMYSKSGGHSGSCSYHGGNWRPLYAP